MRFASVAVSVLVAASLAAPPAGAANDVRQPGRTGIGIGSGTFANGLSLKNFVSARNAFQANLGSWGGGGWKDRWGHYGGLAFSLDYLYSMPVVGRAGNVVEFAWNAGVGAGIGVSDFEDRVAVAAAGVVGLEVLLVPAPFDLVVEWRPTLGVVPGIGIDAIDFTAHLRIYF